MLGYVICASLYYYIERKFEGDAFYISAAHGINTLKDFQKVRFSSELDTSKKVGTCDYLIHIVSEDKGSNKSINVEKRVSVTDFYDEKGYLHRYKVREFFDDLMKAFINKPR